MLKLLLNIFLHAIYTKPLLALATVPRQHLVENYFKLPKKDKKVLLRVVSHEVVAADSLPVHEAVVNSNFEPVLYALSCSVTANMRSADCSGV